MWHSTLSLFIPITVGNELHWPRKKESSLKPPGTENHLHGEGVVLLPAQIPRRISVGMVIALVLWLVIVAGATVLMTRYSSTPGHTGAVPGAWPSDSQITFDSKRPTLVMFVHPHCPCSRASLGELERLLAQVPGRLTAHVVFFKPANASKTWEKTDLWRKASSIPDAAVYTDNDGIEARRFQSQTSGQTLLYDSTGSLRFQGGITFARGHSGDNAGSSALQEFLREGHSMEVKTPVFGCALFAAHCEKGDVRCKP